METERGREREIVCMCVCECVCGSDELTCVVTLSPVTEKKTMRNEQMVRRKAKISVCREDVKLFHSNE
jgi:hypothetical protein